MFLCHSRAYFLDWTELDGQLDGQLNLQLVCTDFGRHRRGVFLVPLILSISSHSSLMMLWARNREISILPVAITTVLVSYRGYTPPIQHLSHMFQPLLCEVMWKKSMCEIFICFLVRFCQKLCSRSNRACFLFGVHGQVRIAILV